MEMARTSEIGKQYILQPCFLKKLGYYTSMYCYLLAYFSHCLFLLSFERGIISMCGVKGAILNSAQSVVTSRLVESGCVTLVQSKINSCGSFSGRPHVDQRFTNQTRWTKTPRRARSDRDVASRGRQEVQENDFRGSPLSVVFGVKSPSPRNKWDTRDLINYCLNYVILVKQTL